ncbi:hypothetical protein EDB92DRAFT_1954654 [Lactarius akahatsu]|uniref:Uncharacterized protein n=1 Tax=Lactarius akahatsu TaxID=416441 RepID=A0AAD4L8M3_9AGAM|nr:hypothetical protein EDB92DRAFT_1954654 [Lactarius akahatsu]
MGQLCFQCENNQREHITSKMPHQIAILIVGAVAAVLAVYVGQNPVGPVEAWMKTMNLSIAIGLNVMVQLYWGGGLIGGNLTPFRPGIPVIYLCLSLRGSVDFPADVAAYQVHLHHNDHVASPYHSFFIIDSTSWVNAKYIDQIPQGVIQLEDLHAYFGRDESLQPHPAFYPQTFANRNFRLTRIATHQEA